MKIHDRTPVPETSTSTKLLNRSPDSSTGRDLNSEQKQQRRRRRRIRNDGFSGSGIRLRKKGGAFSGKRSGPTTPLLRWKFGDGGVYVAGDAVPEGEDCLVSARKLGAGLWQLQREIVIASVDGDGGESGSLMRKKKKKTPDRLGFQNGGDLCKGTSKDLLQTGLSASSPRNGIVSKVETSFSYADSAMEWATKWDHKCSKTSEDINRSYDQMKQILGSHQISTLQDELEEARSRIRELENERQSSKKKFEHFMRKLSEDKASWRMREHEKVRAIIDDIKDDLSREKKSRKRMEIVNAKLINELAEVKLSAKQFMQDYEKERKGRELMEEVCDELAREIGEEKGEVEALKRESMTIREEVEEERRMLQMAEVWREERVQMKLIDAKLTLENKYSQLNKLITDVENFLKLRGAAIDTMEIREAKLLQQAANSAKVHEIKEFHYEPPKSEDIFSVVEELQPVGPNEGETESCLDYSPTGCGSKVHSASPKFTVYNKNYGQKYTNGFVMKKDAEEEGSGWETESHAEEQDSSYSPEGSDLSVNRARRDIYLSDTGTEWEEKTNRDSPNTEISEISYRSKKGSLIPRIWRSNPHINGEGINRKLSNRIISNGGVASPSQGSAEGGLSPRNFIGRWSLSDSADSGIAQGNQNSSLKAKLLEARMQNQKIQLRQVLKQKT